MTEGETWDDPKISIQHSPIADLEHPSALSIADCKRIFQIGDRRMLNADFRTTFFL